MQLLPISRYPDRILRQKAAWVTSFDTPLQKLMDQMIFTMYHSPGTIGLAAPQVGHSLQLAVVDVSSKEKRHGLLILINPVILAASGEILLREGCLSLPDYTGNVKRFENVTVRAHNREGKIFEITTSGIEAICLQHEIDHLTGLMFLDRVDSLKTDIFRRKRYQKPNKLK